MKKELPPCLALCRGNVPSCGTGFLSAVRYLFCLAQQHGTIVMSMNSSFYFLTCTGGFFLQGTFKANACVYNPSSPADNGLNPTWPRKAFQFSVCNSAFAFLRFVVYEIDMFSDQNFLAQATFPIHSLKTGTPTRNTL